jgi:hypothetical protein
MGPDCAGEDQQQFTGLGLTLPCHFLVELPSSRNVIHQNSVVLRPRLRG